MVVVTMANVTLVVWCDDNDDNGGSGGIIGGGGDSGVGVTTLMMMVVALPMVVIAAVTTTLIVIEMIVSNIGNVCFSKFTKYFFLVLKMNVKVFWKWVKNHFFSILAKHVLFSKLHLKTKKFATTLHTPLGWFHLSSPFNHFTLMNTSNYVYMWFVKLQFPLIHTRYETRRTTLDKDTNYRIIFFILYINWPIMDNTSKIIYYICL